MTIVVTLPHFWHGEAERIVMLLHRGDVDFVHIRKPEASLSQIEQLIEQIPQQLHPRLTLHDYHILAPKHSIGGIHLNSRNPTPLAEWRGRISISCHSIKELSECQAERNYTYMSLSPIFDSISKQGYKAAFTPQEIEEARQQGVINSKVLALGGVRFSTIDDVIRMGFGGAMILGDAWK